MKDQIVTVEYNINCSIYRDGDYDCILNYFVDVKRVTVVNSIDDYLNNFKGKSCIIIISKIVFGDVILYAYPVDESGQIKKGMFGGNFVYTSDSRFPHDTPIRLMDRFET
jgi:hypothetical protein